MNRIIAKIPSMNDEELRNLGDNAKKLLPDAQQVLDAVIAEQLSRGGTAGMNPDSVREVILSAARRGEKITYKEVISSFGIPFNKGRFPLFPILGSIAVSEHEAGRPALTAVVVTEHGTCGPGFVEQSRKLGRKILDEAGFEDEERQQVFAYWQDK